MTNQGAGARETGAHPLHRCVTYSYRGFISVTGFFSMRDKKMSRLEKKRGGGTVKERYAAETETVQVYQSVEMLNMSRCI